MEYIQSLRQHIGHAPILTVGAVVLIVDEKNRLFMIKRSDNRCWGVPGGAVELGEKVEDAARRETLEECGLQVDVMSLFDVFSGLECYYRYPNGDEVYNVSIVYLSYEVSGTIHLSEEHTEWRWFGIDEIPKEISPPIIPFIDRYKQINRKS